MRPKLELLYTTARQIRSFLEYPVPLRLAPWRRSYTRSLPPNSRLLLCQLTVWCCYRNVIALVSRIYFYKNELSRCLLSRLTLSYCAPMHQRWCQTARQAQEKDLKGVATLRRKWKLFLFLWTEKPSKIAAKPKRKWKGVHFSGSLPRYYWKVDVAPKILESRASVISASCRQDRLPRTFKPITNPPYTVNASSRKHITLSGREATVNDYRPRWFTKPL